MTGYGYGEYQDEEQHVLLEIRSYNNRYLDVWVNLPQSLNALEPRFREYLVSKIGRGKVELSLRYRKLKNELSFIIDGDSITGFAETLREIAKAAGIEADISLSHILTMEDLVRQKREIDVEKVWKTLTPLLDSTFSDFNDSRGREGEITKKHIFEHLSVLSRTVDTIKERARELEENLITTIRERFETVLGSKIDEDRVLAETAVLLVKFSIDEELSRLTGHLDAFKRTAAQSEPVGKKLDFLCQELHREINTVGSKSTVYEINSSVVEAKDALEKIREQLRNVE